MMPTTTRRRRGDLPPALAVLRLRCFISFLRLHRLYAIAYALEKQTGVFFDAACLRRMLLRDRYAAASSYALSFVDDVRTCSREADWLNIRILILRVLAAFAAGRPRAVSGLFRCLYDNLDIYRDCDAIRCLLLSMQSDHTKSSILFRRIKSKAVQIIMDLVAKCPSVNTIILSDTT